MRYRRRRVLKELPQSMLRPFGLRLHPVFEHRQFLVLELVETLLLPMRQRLRLRIVRHVSHSAKRFNTAGVGWGCGPICVYRQHTANRQLCTQGRLAAIQHEGYRVLRVGYGWGFWNGSRPAPGCVFAFYVRFPLHVERWRSFSVKFKIIGCDPTFHFSTINCQKFFYFCSGT